MLEYCFYGSYGLTPVLATVYHQTSGLTSSTVELCKLIQCFSPLRYSAVMTGDLCLLGLRYTTQLPSDRSIYWRLTVSVSYLGFCLANCTTSCCMNCLTPLELPSCLQNLMVSRASWGTNLPRPLARGALLLIQPDLRNSAALVIPGPSSAININLTVETTDASLCTVTA